MNPWKFSSYGQMAGVYGLLQLPYPLYWTEKKQQLSSARILPRKKLQKIYLNKAKKNTVSILIMLRSGTNLLMNMGISSM